VSAFIGGRWVALPRSTANRFQYSGDAGEWNQSGPLKVRVTSVTGETVEDALPGLKGGGGTAQFTKYAKPAGLPPLSSVWPGYGKPWAERVFKGVAARGPVMPRPSGSAAKKAATPAAATATTPGAGAVAAPAVAPHRSAAPGAARVEHALQPAGSSAERDAAAEVEGQVDAATEAAVDAVVKAEATAKPTVVKAEATSEPTVVKAEATAQPTVIKAVSKMTVT
jgi:hypothetical protein